MDAYIDVWIEDDADQSALWREISGIPSSNEPTEYYLTTALTLNFRILETIDFSLGILIGMQLDRWMVISC